MREYGIEHVTRVKVEVAEVWGNLLMRNQLLLG